MKDLVIAYFLENLAEIVAAAIGLYLTPFLTRLIISVRSKVDENTIVNRLDKEGLIRQSLNESVRTAVDSGLREGLTPEQIIHQKVKYVEKAAPDSKLLGATREIIQDKLSAELARAINGIAR